MADHLAALIGNALESVAYDAESREWVLHCRHESYWPDALFLIVNANNRCRKRQLDW